MLLDQAEMQATDGAHGSEPAEHNNGSGSGLVSSSLANGIATGAALVSTGLHAAAEIAKTSVLGQDRAESDKDVTEEGEDGQKEQKEAKQEGFRLRFGTFDDSLADNILGDAPAGLTGLENGECSGSVTPVGHSSRPASRESSVISLTPVPSQAIDAKPFVPTTAEPSAVETAVALKPSAGTLNVNAREFTPGAAAVAAAPRAADAPGGVQLSAAADVMWSDVGITDDADTAQDWSQWGYADQAVWNEEYQEYGTWAMGTDGQYVWYPSEVATSWDAAYAGGQYWSGNGGYYMRGSGRAAGGHATNVAAGGHAANADGKSQNGAAAAINGAAKRMRRDKKREGKQQNLREVHGAEAVRAASLAVLEGAFPAYSRSSLRDMLAGSKDDLARTLDWLAALEAEQVKQPPKGPKGEVLVLDEENFPALSAASSPAKPLSKRAAAAAATGRPASPDTPLMDRADEASTPDASRSTSPAPAAAAQRAAAAATEPAEESGAVANAAAATAADAQAAAADADSAPASKAAEAAAASTEPGAEEAAPGAAASCAAAAAEDGEAGAAGEGTEEEEQSGSAAPGPAQLSAPPTPAWGRKDRPAFLQAGSADTEAAHGATAAATKPELAGAPKRAVPITQSTSVARKAGRRAAAGNAPWVATGAAADAQYSDKRAIARDHMRARNQYFQQATQAYLGGDKALAKELGEKGRWHAAKMLAAHAEASDAIFRQRNPNKGAGGGQVAVIDMHGQHVDEALKLLRREMTRLRLTPTSGQNRQQATARAGAAPPQRIQILVGTGHHSKGKHTPTRLPAAVEEFLKNEGIAFKKPLPGALEIVA